MVIKIWCLKLDIFIDESL